MKKRKGKGDGVEGEGSYTATRQYSEDLARSIAKGDSDELAREAEKALEGPEGTELRKAERFAKAGKPKHAHRHP